MPRANRHHIPGQIWHITHRCHQRQFLLRFSKDRKRWLQWLFEAKKRFGLSILDYMVTSNHIHLLVVDDESNAISKSLQLIAGRTAQGFNQRKGRKGAFWEDRYHATAIEGGEYLLRCLVYIDMNMVRAGVVSHPSEWPHSGYLDIQTPPERYGLIDLERLIEITGTASHEQLKEQHRDWVDQAVRGDANARHIEWTEAVAVGSIGFVEDLKARLGYAVAGRRVQPAGGTQMLREPELAYGAHLGAEKQCLSLENTVYFDINNEESIVSYANTAPTPVIAARFLKSSGLSGYCPGICPIASAVAIAEASAELLYCLRPNRSIHEIGFPPTYPNGFIPPFNPMENYGDSLLNTLNSHLFDFPSDFASSPSEICRGRSLYTDSHTPSLMNRLNVELW